MDDVRFADRVRAQLDRNGCRSWRVEPGDFWYHVRPPECRQLLQGWKLHVSATPLSAPLVLDRVTPVLAAHGCPFKFAATSAHVRDLSSAHSERGAGGKFITAYPVGDDAELRALADDLHAATAGLAGPGILSDRQYRPGSLVHYRFGVMGGAPVLAPDGSYEAMLVTPDGMLALDHRNAWFSPPSWATPDPFVEDGNALPARATRPRTILLDDRYEVDQAIRHNYKGGVYRATDRRTGARVVVKQARAHVGTTADGSDVRDMLRHEARMLTVLGGTGVSVRVVGLFEQQNDLFLVQEEVRGSTLRNWARTRIEYGPDGRWGLPEADVRRVAGDLVELVGLVHRRGLVLQDLNPNNVMVDEDGRLRLIDLELAGRPGEQLRRAYTPGYGAPEQRDPGAGDEVPEQPVDLFALGATLFFLLTGVDPLLADDDPPTRPDTERLASWLALMAVDNDVARQLTPTVVALMHTDPVRRPSLDAVRRALSRPVPAVSRVPGSRADVDWPRLAADGLDHIVETMQPDDPHTLWPRGANARPTDPFCVQLGAAGVLDTLLRAERCEPDERIRAAIGATAHWIRRHVLREPRVLPGLHLGRAGTAWALLEAGTHLADRSLTRVAGHLARQLPLSWPNPDVCNGTAGAGLTQLRFWELTGDTAFLDRVATAADSVMHAADRRDGRVVWPVPAGFASSLAGTTSYGFAHGVAGIGAFLLAAARALDAPTCRDVALDAAETLVRAAQLDGGAAYWPRDDDDPRPLTHWCSGSSGIATFLLRVWQETGDDRFLELTVQAAEAVHRHRWRVGTSQCHGLAGDGEFLLDLADATGEERHRHRAVDLATALHVRHVQRSRRLLVPDDGGSEVHVSFNSGLAGVVSFLLRLRHGGPRAWQPDTLTRPAPPQPGR